MSSIKQSGRVHRVTTIVPCTTLGVGAQASASDRNTPGPLSVYPGRGPKYTKLELAIWVLFLTPGMFRGAKTITAALVVLIRTETLIVMMRAAELHRILADIF